MIKSRLESKYKEEIRPALQKEFGLNIMEVPKIKKVVLNVGAKEAVSDSKYLKVVVDVLEKISGQRPVKTVAKKSIAGFKIREGMPLGAKVTIRKDLMYHFLDQLLTIVLPAIRDFNGVPLKLDNGNSFNFGVKEWTIFPGVEKVAGDVVSGLNITVHISAKNNEQSLALLKHMGMPFKKR